MAQNDKAQQEALQVLHEIVAKELTARISSGEAKPADLQAAIKFLKDNEITVGQIKPGSPVDTLIKKMPFPEEELQESPYLN
jgi:hypothetical protein